MCLYEYGNAGGSERERERKETVCVHLALHAHTLTNSHSSTHTRLYNSSRSSLGMRMCCSPSWRWCAGICQGQSPLPLTSRWFSTSSQLCMCTRRRVACDDVRFFFC